MSGPTPEEQRQLILQWEETGRELDRIRREALRGREYSFEELDAVQQLGDGYDGPPRLTSGLVELHYWLERAYEKQIAKESAIPNGDGQVHGEIG